MKNYAFLLTCSVLASALASQSGPTIKILTATDYSMVVDNGSGEIIDGKPANTFLTLPLTLEAKATGASANNKTEAITSTLYGKGIRIHEYASAWSNSSTAERLAGTLDELENDHHEPHSLIMAISGTSKPAGIVTISWKASATAVKGLATTSIDLNGDTVPDFTGDADGTTHVNSYWVTATPAGYFFVLTTHGAVDYEGKGSASFDLDLSVWFREASSGTAIGAFGPECGGALAGSVEDAWRGNQNFTLSLSGAAKNALGAAVISPSSANLPFGACQLLVAPDLVLAFHADSNGRASMTFKVPTGFPFNMLAQDVLVWQNGASLQIGTSNAVRIERR